MATFIFAYHGGQPPANEEEYKVMFAKWNEWIETNADKFENPGKPVGKSKYVSKEGVADSGPDPIMGFSLVKAESIDEAIEFAKTCPHYDLDGATIEVADVV